MEKRKVIIVGTGPAGLTAAVYTARAGLKPLVIEGMQPGGQLTMTTEVENFPGFPQGVMGPELMANMREQAERFDAEFCTTNVENVTLNERPFHLTCSSGQEFLTESLIIATGASARTLNLPNEKELIGRGVSTCATCDGFFYRDRIIHVVGGGDTAMEEALFLTKFASKVYIVHRRDELRASKPMQEKAFANEKIEFVWDSSVAELIHDNTGLKAIVVENLKTGERTTRETDGLFYGIGHTPNTSFLKGQVDSDDHGYLITKPSQPDTNIPGVFACGDVKDSYYRQAITAAGSGCQAAIRCERYLELEAES